MDNLDLISNHLGNDGDLSATNEVNTAFGVNGANLSITDSFQTLSVPLASLGSDDQNLENPSLDGSSQLQINIENGTGVTVDLSPLEETAFIDANTTAIANNATQITNNTADIGTNTTAIAGNAADILNNSGDIAANTAAIAADTDGDPNNEIQNLTQVLAQGNSAGNNAISDMLNPVNPQDAATKDYVDNLSVNDAELRPYQ